MSMDREIFKRTAYVDRLIKEGYTVVLISANVFEVRDVIRGTKVGDESWNHRLWAADINRRPGPYRNWPKWASDSDWNDMMAETYNNTIATDTAKLSIKSTPSGRSKRSRRWFMNKKRVPWCPEPWYHIKVMVCITHPDALEHNSVGQTVSRNPDMPVALPGKWGPARYYLDGVYMNNMEHFRELDAHDCDLGIRRPEDDNIASQKRRVERTGKYRTDGISGAQVFRPDDEFVNALHHPSEAFWNLRTDITEDCAEVVFFEELTRNEPEEVIFKYCEGIVQNAGGPYLLYCKDVSALKVFRLNTKS